MVTSGSQFCDVSYFAQVFKQVSFKLGSLISNYLLWESIFAEEVVSGSLSCCHGCLI